MLINGKCHCGNIAFTLDWPDNRPDIPARVCSCTFCVKHGGAWTSDPAAKLSVVVADIALVSRYKFATETAIFHICARCGAVPVVTSELEGHLYAVVNVNSFEGFDPSRLRRKTTNFDGEDIGARLARRSGKWIGEVRISQAVG